jgi:DNA (cytosine-5)-methyltransferase 1
MRVTGPKLRHRRQQLSLSQAKLAELCGISQHLLSAFELEKAELPSSTLDTVLAALSDESRVAEIARRSKRYRHHKYCEVKCLPERIARARRTAGNIEYCCFLNEIARLHATPKTPELTGLSLFSGCGGFSLGFSASGFLVKAFLEIEPNLKKIYKQNFPDSCEIGGDITTIRDSTISYLPERLGQIDAIIGGPPCQGFSLSGKRQVDDPRNTLFKHYLRFVDVLRPKFAVLENVRLLTSMKTPSGSHVKDNICEEFGKHGYSVRCFEINAKNYGVPQHRERVLFIALRLDLNLTPTLPVWTHGDAADMFSSLAPCRTFADACSDLPYLESGDRSDDRLHQAVRHPAHIVEWLWDVPEGASAHDNEDPGKRPPSGYNTTYKRQVWSEPAATVQTTFGMISGCRNVHPIATRSLTVREAARIQSFPDSYCFDGNLGAIRTGIGNAVPPLLAYWIAMYAKGVIQACRSIHFSG